MGLAYTRVFQRVSKLSATLWEINLNYLLKPHPFIQTEKNVLMTKSSVIQHQLFLSIVTKSPAYLLT